MTMKYKLIEQSRLNTSENIILTKQKQNIYVYYLFSGIFLVIILVVKIVFYPYEEDNNFMIFTQKVAKLDFYAEKTKDEKSAESSETKEIYQNLQEYRTNYLRNQCMKYPELSSWSIQDQNYVYNLNGTVHETTGIVLAIKEYYTSRIFNLEINNQNLIACLPPKSGTSNWQRLLIYLTHENMEKEDAFKINGKSENDRIANFTGINLYQELPRFNDEVFPDSGHRRFLKGTELKKLVKASFRGKFKILNNDSDLREEIEKLKNLYEIMNDSSKYKKSLLNTRHPFDRLWSGYNSKFTIYHKNPKGELTWNKYAEKINQLYNLNKKTGSFLKPLPKHKRIHFEHFLRYIVDVDLHHLDSEFGNGYTNIHWNPIYRHCSPCLINYTDITRTKGLYFESHAFFEQFGEEVWVPSRTEVSEAKRKDDGGGRRKREIDHSSDKASDETIEVFRKLIPNELTRRVYQAYKYDFELFGYNTEGFDV